MVNADHPLCGNCNHTKTFHSGGKSRCKAFGCDCSRWKPAHPVPAKKKKAKARR